MKTYIAPQIECIEIHAEGLIADSEFRTQLNVAFDTQSEVTKEGDFAATSYRTNLWD